MTDSNLSNFFVKNAFNQFLEDKNIKYFTNIDNLVDKFIVYLKDTYPGIEDYDIVKPDKCRAIIVNLVLDEFNADPTHKSAQFNNFISQKNHLTDMGSKFGYTVKNKADDALNKVSNTSLDDLIASVTDKLNLKERNIDFDQLRNRIQQSIRQVYKTLDNGDKVQKTMDITDQAMNTTGDHTDNTTSHISNNVVDHSKSILDDHGTKSESNDDASSYKLNSLRLHDDVDAVLAGLKDATNNLQTALDTTQSIQEQHDEQQEKLNKLSDQVMQKAESDDNDSINNQHDYGYHVFDTEPVDDDIDDAEDDAPDVNAIFKTTTAEHHSSEHLLAIGLAMVSAHMIEKGLLTNNYLMNITYNEGVWRMYLSILDPQSDEILGEASYSKKRNTFAYRYATKRNNEGALIYTDWEITPQSIAEDKWSKLLTDDANIAKCYETICDQMDYDFSDLDND